MVNTLLTIPVRVNIAVSCRIVVEKKGREMKTTKNRTVPFWTWLLGGGTASGGSNG
jgi:hypothetical protein